MADGHLRATYSLASQVDSSPHLCNTALDEARHEIFVVAGTSGTLGGPNPRIPAIPIPRTDQPHPSFGPRQLHRGMSVHQTHMIRMPKRPRGICGFEINGRSGKEPERAEIVTLLTLGCDEDAGCSVGVERLGPPHFRHLTLQMRDVLLDDLPDSLQIHAEVGVSEDIS